MSDDDVASLGARLVRSGHMSALEHASFTFAVDGISRACSHQLVRHRVASYSQQSQRYVRFGSDGGLRDASQHRRLFRGPGGLSGGHGERPPLV